jgi:hypothetical protein
MKPGRHYGQRSVAGGKKGPPKQAIKETDLNTGKVTIRPVGQPANPGQPSGGESGGCAFIFLLLIGSPIAWLASTLFQ